MFHDVSFDGAVAGALGASGAVPALQEQVPVTPWSAVATTPHYPMMICQRGLYIPCLLVKAAPRKLSVEVNKGGRNGASAGPNTCVLSDVVTTRHSILAVRSIASRFREVVTQGNDMVGPVVQRAQL